MQSNKKRVSYIKKDIERINSVDSHDAMAESLKGEITC